MKARLLISIATAALLVLSVGWVLPDEGSRFEWPAPIHSLYHGYLAGRASGSWIFSMAEALGNYAVHGESSAAPSACYVHERGAATPEKQPGQAVTLTEAD